MKKASEKQVRFAQMIARELRIALPIENTSYAYWKFISDNKDRYEQSLRNAASEFHEEYIPCEWFC